MNAWIDFKELRSRLDFEQVLRHYGVEVRRKGDQYHGYCPLPNHKGVRNSPSFSANLARGIFKCFGCQAQGNLLDFAVLMTGRNPDDPGDVRTVAVDLHERFVGPVSSPSSGRNGMPATPVAPTPPQTTTDKRPRVVNAPLDFELKGLDASHPYLQNRRFTAETIAHFGLGFCSRGSLTERIAIPLHSATGRLIGYAGRVVDDDLISEDNPKYRFPGKRERKGALYEFQKSRFVYNGHRIRIPVDDLVVVEGFPSVWWLWQCGIENTVAVMGSNCAERQAELIVDLVSPPGRVWIMPDGNEAGEHCASSLLELISPHRFVRWVKLADGKQPTDLGCDKLHALFKQGGRNEGD